MVKLSCEMQLKLLGVDYLDLYLMHSPVGVDYVSDDDLMPHENDQLRTNDVDYVDTYKSMEQLVHLGLVRSLGLSNLNARQLKRVLEHCQIKPVSLQIECHLELVQIPLIELCKFHNITVVAYSPLGRPKACNPLPEYYTDSKLLALATKYGKTPVQIILRYLIAIGTVPIPKAAQRAHLVENLDIFDFHLTPEELLQLKSFNTGRRIWRNNNLYFKSSHQRLSYLS